MTSTHPPCGLHAGPVAKLHVELPDGVEVADQVVITYGDCCAAGPRMLHSLQLGGGVTVQRAAFSLTGVDASHWQTAVSAPHDASTQAPLQLVNITPAGQTQPQVTFVCLNCAVVGEDVAHVVAAVLAWLQARTTPTLPPVVVAAAVVMQGLKAQGGHTLAINGAPVPPGLATAPALPPSTRLQDEFLPALTLALYVSGLPALCVLVPGHKPSAGSGLGDSVDTVMQLASLLTSAGVPVTCADVARVEVVHRWYAPVGPGGGEIMYV